MRNLKIRLGSAPNDLFILGKQLLFSKPSIGAASYPANSLSLSIKPILAVHFYIKAKMVAMDAKN